MTDQPAPPAAENRPRRASKATRTLALVVIALALAVLAGSSFYTTWLQDDPEPEPALDYTEDMAFYACMELAHSIIVYNAPALRASDESRHMLSLASACDLLYGVGERWDTAVGDAQDAYDARHSDE